MTTDDQVPAAGAAGHPEQHGRGGSGITRSRLALLLAAMAAADVAAFVLFGDAIRSFVQATPRVILGLF
ncbi:hypothetical protein OHQ88_34015 (plasmid) [Micromonospora zamorensis]|uniref:hypothetical protein n=1 Tax=Micromonospora zamorensis TaxID=709883 RepID=UPI002E1A2CB1